MKFLKKKYYIWVVKHLEGDLQELLHIKAIDGKYLSKGEEDCPLLLLEIEYTEDSLRKAKGKLQDLLLEGD